MTRSALLLLFLLCYLAMPASAQTPRSVFLEELTWTEVRDQTQAGRTTILVPIGGTEQSGPYIALGKHNARVRVLAQKIALGLGNALVAPVLSYVPEGTVNPPVAHMRFPGTITAPEDAFEKVLESAARGFRLHGFKDIAFLGDHGGYQKSLARVAERLNHEWSGTSVRVHAVPEFYQAADEGFAQLLKEKGFKPAEIGTHAGLADTSLTLALVPELVRSDRLATPNKGAADGVQGDARRATAELGKLGVDLIVERTVEGLRKATARR